MENIKFYYFDTRARGELIRLLLHAGGQKFEDIIIPTTTWGPEVKKGFMGKTDEDALRVNEVMQLGHDFRRPKLRDWMVEKDPSKKAEKAQLLKDETFPRYLAYFEALLVDNEGTGFFVGDSVSVADLYVYDLLDTVLGIDHEVLGAFPSQRKLRSNVEALPSLKDYLTTRRVTAF